MSNPRAWIEYTDELLEELLEQRSRLSAQLGGLQEALARADNQIESLQTLRDKVTERAGNITEPEITDALNPYADKTTIEALEIFANNHSGRVVVTKAVMDLKRHGFFPKPQHALPSTHSILRRAVMRPNSKWRKTGPGVYRFERGATVGQQIAAGASEIAATLFK